MADLEDQNQVQLNKENQEKNASENNENGVDTNGTTDDKSEQPTQQESENPSQQETQAPEPPKEPEETRKLFLGGLDYKTDEEILRAYFGQWGTIENAVIVKDPVTRRSRGFGFVTYTRSEMVEMVQSNGPHEIDGKTIEPKLAVKKKQEEKETTIKKLFVGGFKEDCEESDLREYFSQFGVVNATNIVMDKQTGKKKGYGFVEFTETVDAGVLEQSHQINNHSVDVKKVIIKQDQKPMNRGRMNKGFGGSNNGRNNRNFNRNQGGNGWNQNMNSNGGNWMSNDFGGSPGYNGWYNQNPWDNPNDFVGNNQGQNWSVDSFGSNYQQNFNGGPARNNFNKPRQQQYGNRGGNRRY